MNLHNQIMNIAEKRPDSSFESTYDRVLYKEGHRDARHAAAELALQAEQDKTTYTVNNEVMSPLEYIDYLHSQLSDCMSETAKWSALAGLNSQDAERYRWLRNKARSVDWSRKWTDSSFTTHTRYNGQSMDAAIDAAIDKELGK